MALARTVLALPAVAGVRTVSAARKAANEGVRRTVGSVAVLAVNGPARRVWANGGRAHIQANGLSGGGERPGGTRGR